MVHRVGRITWELAPLRKLGGLLHIRPDSGELEASRGVGFLRMCESPPIKKHLNQGWYGLLLRGGPVRHLGDAAVVNLDRCGGRPQSLSEATFLQLYQPVYVVAEDKHPMTRMIARQSYIA